MLEYDIFSLSNKQIEKEGIEEVTSPKIFIREGEPDPKGLASYEIFGEPGSEARSHKYGYIRLGDIFVHPHVVFELKFVKRKFFKLITGAGIFRLTNKGDIEEVGSDEDTSDSITGTGPKFLYKIWDKLDFRYKKEKPGSVRYVRMRFLSTLDKKQAFMDKMLVVPAFYRDVDLISDKKNEVNSMYIKLMNLASTIKMTSKMAGVFDELSDAHRAIISTLQENYETTIKMYGGRKGYIHKHVMGKKIDFSARLVLSSVDLSKTEGVDTLPTTFESCQIPLFAVIKCFAPFIVNGIRNIIEDIMSGSDFLWKLNSKGEMVREKVASDWKKILSSDNIYSLMNLFDESREHRLDTFNIPMEDGTELPLGYWGIDGDKFDIDVNEEHIKDKFKNSKPMSLTLLHLFYMAAINTTSDKHVMITRYPIEDHNNTFPAKVNINPYKRTMKLISNNGIVYDKFPVIKNGDMDKIESMFTDSMVIFPGMLSALNADFDGDQVYIIGLFTKEANEDADNYITSISNMVGVDGKTTRKFGILAEHVIHIMSY